MNRGMYDDEDEVPGNGPTVILAHMDGDETVLPHAVEQRLRDCRPSNTSSDPVNEAAAARLRMGIGTLTLDEVDVEAARRRDEYEAKWRRVREFVGPPPDEPALAPEPGRPTVVALMVCVMALLVVVCLLVALRVGGAIAWDWAWVLAPLWVPVSVATVALLLACVWLAALDEREAARRRNLVGKGN